MSKRPAPPKGKKGVIPAGFKDGGKVKGNPFADKKAAPFPPKGKKKGC